MHCTSFYTSLGHNSIYESLPRLATGIFHLYHVLKVGYGQFPSLSCRNLSRKLATGIFPLHPVAINIMWEFKFAGGGNFIIIQSIPLIRKLWSESGEGRKTTTHTRKKSAVKESLGSRKIFKEAWEPVTTRKAYNLHTWWPLIIIKKIKIKYI